MTSEERNISIETVRIPPYRESYGNLKELGASIASEGLHRPITVWTDGTLISGARRLRTQFLLAGEPNGSKYRHIAAVFVDNIEDAAKRLLGDNGDEQNALPMKYSEICRLWERLRKLDEPAATRRADQARRRGVTLRRQTVAGDRKPGRNGYSEDYLLKTAGEPFGLSASSATRLWAIYSASCNEALPARRRELARDCMAALDAGEGSIWTSYKSVISGRRPQRRAPAGQVVEAAPAARQLAAWARSLPQMEGLVAGLVQLGPPSDELTWDQIGPVHVRLMSIRRDLEKMIKKMKESNPS